MTTGRRTLSVACTSTDHDTMPWLTPLAIAIPVVGAVFQAVGGPPFDLPMPTFALGIVTPTCGLTRATSALASGDVGSAWAYNPASLLVAAAVVAALARAVWGKTTGTWFAVSVHPTRWAWLGLFVAIAALWANQQSNADLIMAGWA